jgi:peptidyl-prolyl cis-trans isomerase B (cyclophilin B)
MADQGQGDVVEVEPLPRERGRFYARTSGLAVASLILGILGLCTSGLTALAGLILGICALSAISKSGGRLKGQGLALAGTIISAVFVLVGLLSAVALLPALARARGEARKVRCGSNLSQIAKATNLYMIQYGGAVWYPPSLKTLLDTGIIDEPKVFLCPAADTGPGSAGFVSDYESVLDRAGFPISEEMAGSMLPLAWDKKGNHDDGVNVVYFDCHVDFKAGSGEYEEVLREVDAWIAENKP